METPKLNHLTHSDFEQVYEPAEDTFLMMDALEQDFGLIKTSRPSLIVEVCAGTGIIGTALSKALCISPAFFIATDINDLACKASHDTFLCNGINTCEVIRADLLTFLASGFVDILICNPPYVPTTEEELNSSDKLTRSWAGGENGRKVMDRLFKDVPRLLSQEGIFYLLVVKENRPSEIIDIFHEYGFKSEAILSRRAGRENLSVIRFTRNKD